MAAGCEFRRPHRLKTSDSGLQMSCFGQSIPPRANCVAFALNGRPRADARSLANADAAGRYHAMIERDDAVGDVFLKAIGSQRAVAALAGDHDGDASF
jgi:hypothetical protein